MKILFTLKRLTIALVIALVSMTLVAESASATTGGKIRNRSTWLIDISAYNPPFSWAVMQPGTNSESYMSNVQCFKPRSTMKSQYGGIYSANVVRCMSTNNVILWLYDA